jgi:2-polyprenyl-3-methyl-5-hydroxy-6-metoxy-1,4-benzoquinol methylase/uncharacterized protein YbaR (Trm112 family)
MRSELLKYLRCPLTGEELKCTIYDIKSNDEIITGILTSPSGFVFPIIGGIPRLQIEGLIIYEEFFTKFLAGFDEKKQELMKSRRKLVRQRYKANKATRKSFSFEWNLLQRGNTKVGHNDLDEHKATTIREIGQPLDWFNDKLVVDIGCGHGITSEAIASLGATVIAMDMSSSIEEAYKANKTGQIHYIQADLQYPPLAREAFDLVFSSGVIHHTHSTQHSLEIIQKLTKKEGEICLWLYHPVKSVIHKLMLAVRPVTKRIPLKILFWLLMVTLIPVYKLVVFIKGKKLGWREMMIDFIDILTPKYRYEHPFEEVSAWLNQFGFQEIKETTANMFGFSVTAIRK